MMQLKKVVFKKKAEITFGADTTIEQEARLSTDWISIRGGNDARASMWDDYGYYSPILRAPGALPLCFA